MRKTAGRPCPAQLHWYPLADLCGIFPWDLEKDGHEADVRIDGQLVFNNISLRLNSALDGLAVQASVIALKDLRT